MNIVKNPAKITAIERLFIGILGNRINERYCFYVFINISFPTSLQVINCTWCFHYRRPYACNINEKGHKLYMVCAHISWSNKNIGFVIILMSHVWVKLWYLRYLSLETNPILTISKIISNSVEIDHSQSSQLWL